MDESESTPTPGPESTSGSGPKSSGAAGSEPREAAQPTVPPRRASPGELISAGCAIGLLVLMFALEWFGVDKLPGGSTGVQRETAENAWQALTALRWLMLLTIVVAIGSVLLHATQHGHGVHNDTSGVVTVLGSLTAVLLIYRVLINLPNPDAVVDQKLGAVLGLLSAIGIAIGGYRSRLDERTRRGSAQPSRRRREGLASGLRTR